MNLYIDPKSIDDYKTFLAVKRLPTYRINGRMAWFPDEYADRLGLSASSVAASAIETHPDSFDYQAAITRLAIEKERFAVFMECGYGKTLVMLDWMRHALKMLASDRCGLIVSPLMVIEQTVSECQRFFGDSMPIEVVPSGKLQEWLDSGTGRLGITNYEAFKGDVPLQRGRLGALSIDESSMLKSHYGHYGQGVIELGRGLRWKLALTGTPAPNDRIEYANHAIFLDHYPTVNSFLARYFVNRGQTQERWELKPHAIGPFYRDLSHWCIFMSNPATYGWHDNTSTIPPMHVHIEHVELTGDQDSAVRELTGQLFATSSGGIGQRSKIAQIAKGRFNGGDVATLKPNYIRDRVATHSDESTIIWCKFNPEQEQMASLFPGCANIDGSTPIAKRRELIADFQAGRIKVLVSKPKILGLGLNLQIATRHWFSTLQDSYEEYWQAIKRSNRVGSTKDLNVHIPVTEIEAPMVDNVLRKARDVEADTAYQQELFRNATR
jgi:hypothetical protein